MEFSDIVRISGVKNRPELNSQLAFVVNPTQVNDRVHVAVQKGEGLISLKRDKLTKYIFSHSDRIYQHCAFWPFSHEGKPVVFPIDSWPKWPREEIPYLKKILNWGNPQIMGGITSKGQRKQDFMLYYDADDNHSPQNKFAETICAHMPQFEQCKVVKPKKGYRGICVMVYAPMKSARRNGTLICWSSLDDKRWTLDELLEVITFHGTQEAKDMYLRHSHPTHRVFRDAPEYDEFDTGVREYFDRKGTSCITRVPAQGAIFVNDKKVL